MKIGGGSNMPRATCHGARQETGLVVNEVGENPFNNISREPSGDWGWMCGGRLRGTSMEQPLDFGCGSVPDKVNNPLGRYRNIG